MIKSTKFLPLETKEKIEKIEKKSFSEPVEREAERREESSPTHQKDQEEDEIDLAELIRKVWAGRKTILITTGIIFVIGIFIALASPVEYKSSTTLMPQSSGTGGGGASGLMRQFGGLLDLGGISGGSGGGLSPNLYPDITQSTPFFLYMLEQEVYIANLDTTVSILTYFADIQQKSATDYLKKYTIGLPNLILKMPGRIGRSFQGSPEPVAHAADSLKKGEVLEKDATHQAIKLSNKQVSAMVKLKSRIETTIEKNGMVSVSAKMPDPYMAAQVTELAVEHLKQYVTEYRTEKSKSNLDFLEKQYEEAKERYYGTQQRLARFRDMNSNIITASAQTELERLQNENNLAYSVYQGLAQQLEQARITVQEETPVFKVLEPIQVPLSKSEPNQELILSLSLFVGLFLGFGIVFLKIIFQNIKANLS